jgi:hypothetical protein
MDGWSRTPSHHGAAFGVALREPWSRATSRITDAAPSMVLMHPVAEHAHAHSSTYCAHETGACSASANSSTRPR